MRGIVPSHALSSSLASITSQPGTKNAVYLTTGLLPSPRTARQLTSLMFRSRSTLMIIQRCTVVLQGGRGFGRILATAVGSLGRAWLS
jgi:hypothetical protein